MYRKWKTRSNGYCGCGVWIPPLPTTAVCPAATVVCGSRGSWAIWTPWRGWFYWVALGSGLGPVRAPGIHHYMLLLMTSGTPFQCLQLPAGCSVFSVSWLQWCAVDGEMGRTYKSLQAGRVVIYWGEEVIYKLQAPIKRGNRRQKWDKTDLHFSRGFRLHRPLSIECKLGKDPFLIWMQLFFLLPRK